MKLLLATLFSFSCCVVSLAQIDTTIYEVAEVLPYPLLKSCLPASHPGWNADSTRRCGEIQLLGMLSSNIRYPAEARDKNVQGTVVLSFVVEPSNGRISNVKLLKDIGAGCGEEALRVIKALDEVGLRWQPALRSGQPVRLRHSVPVRFRLQEALPYYISEKGDSIYTNYDEDPAFKAGADSLITFVFNRLEYPKRWQDSCKTGIIEMALLIRGNGTTQVENVLDFNRLDLDFQWEAQRLVNKTTGMWQPAVFGGRPVSTTIPLRVVFKSDEPRCKAANDIFDRTMILADEGSVLLSEEKDEEAIAKWSEALKLQPDNSELLYYRGTAMLNLNRREDACKDFNRIKEIMGVTWFEELRRLVCGW